MTTNGSISNDGTEGQGPATRSRRSEQLDGMLEHRTMPAPPAAASFSAEAAAAALTPAEDIIVTGITLGVRPEPCALLRQHFPHDHLVDAVALLCPGRLHDGIPKVQVDPALAEILPLEFDYRRFPVSTLLVERQLDGAAPIPWSLFVGQLKASTGTED